MSYYGGTELPEALKASRLPTISMGPTGDFVDRSYKITGERIALIAVPEDLRELCIESAESRTFERRLWLVQETVQSISGPASVGPLAIFRHP
jgi:hypothetical protein